jgi:cell division septal protein FtsQ
MTLSPERRARARHRRAVRWAIVAVMCWWSWLTLAMWMTGAKGGG